MRHDDDGNLAHAILSFLAILHLKEQVGCEITNYVCLLLSGQEVGVVAKCQDAGSRQVGFVREPAGPQEIKVAILAPCAEASAAETVDEENVDGPRLLGSIEDR